MAWQLKMSHQNSSESKRNTDFVSVPISRKSKGDCSSDLNLGRLADFVHESSVKSSKSLPSPSSKRPRAPINGNIVFCLVDDCRKDLGNCREYHRRHKVCETHSKTPMVTVDGKEQRFCQQCSRFHLLTEFDEGKRSCRKRLDGHNKRRRKPQHDPLSFNTGSFLLNPQGNRISSHLNPQFDHTTMNRNWFGSIKTSSDVSCHPTQNLGNQARSLHTYFSQNYKPQDFEINLDKMSSETLVHNVPVCPPLDAPLFSENCASLGKLSDGWTRVFDTDYAPSLLSSTIHQNAATSFAGRKQVDQIPIARSSVPSLHFSYQRQHISELSNPTVDFCCSGLRKEPVLISDAVSDGQPENGTSETPPFSWH